MGFYPFRGPVASLTLFKAYYGWALNDPQHLCCILDAFVPSCQLIFGALLAVAHPLPRPGLEAHREAISLAFPELVSRLVGYIGRKLSAYVGRVKDVRTVDGWVQGKAPYGDAEERLRLAFQVVRTLIDHDPPRIVQAWLTGVNPELGDRIPLRLLREGDLNIVGPEVMAAARAFIAGG